MTLLRPLQRYHSQADLIWSDGPFNNDTFGDFEPRPDSEIITAKLDGTPRMHHLAKHVLMFMFKFLMLENIKGWSPGHLLHATLGL
jgi:hypothetical protein